MAKLTKRVVDAAEVQEKDYQAAEKLSTSAGFPVIWTRFAGEFECIFPKSPPLQEILGWLDGFRIERRRLHAGAASSFGNLIRL